MTVLSTQRSELVLAPGIGTGFHNSAFLADNIELITQNCISLPFTHASCPYPDWTRYVRRFMRDGVPPKAGDDLSREYRYSAAAINKN